MEFICRDIRSDFVRIIFSGMYETMPYSIRLPVPLCIETSPLVTAPLVASRAATNTPIR
jgi:hypothetical protein